MLENGRVPSCSHGQAPTEHQVKSHMKVHLDFSQILIPSQRKQAEPSPPHSPATSDNIALIWGLFPVVCAPSLGLWLGSGLSLPACHSGVIRLSTLSVRRYFICK